MTELSENRRYGVIRRARNAFRHWRHSRPFWGGLLVLLSGLQILASTQLSLGNLQIRVGLEGLQSIVIPFALILLGLLIWFMPAHRLFYGALALVFAVYSLVGVNLGGFLIGMLLGILGGSFSIAWTPRESAPRRPATRGGPGEPEPTSQARDEPDTADAETRDDGNVQLQELFEERGRK